MSAPTYSDIVARLAAACTDARACMLLSADGFTLAAFPPEGEDSARSIWDRVQRMGDPERGFLVVDGETWAFARRAGYSALVIGAPGARPGLLLDAIDRALRQLQEGTAPEAAQEQKRGVAPPVRRARASLHRDARRPERPAASRRAEPSGRPERRTERTGQPPPSAPEPVVPVDPLELSREFGALLDEGPETGR